jgi:aminoglycoside phosphotransferase (APT) family kinase protein
VAWFLAHAWRDGPPLPGFPDRAEFCDIYSRKTGRSIRNLLYYEALSLFKFIVIGHLAMRHQADAEQEALDTAFQAFHHGLSTVIASAEKEETA